MSQPSFSEKDWGFEEAWEEALDRVRFLPALDLLLLAALDVSESKEMLSVLMGEADIITAKGMNKRNSEIQRYAILSMNEDGHRPFFAPSRPSAVARRPKKLACPRYASRYDRYSLLV
jgi:hypothetical protein